MTKKNSRLIDFYQSIIGIHVYRLWENPRLHIYVPLRRHDFPERFPSVSNSARVGEDHPSLVWRLSGRVERLPDVLPASASGGLRVFALFHAVPEAATTG